MSGALQAIRNIFRKKSRAKEEDEWSQQYYDIEANGPPLTTAGRLERATNPVTPVTPAAPVAPPAPPAPSRTASENSSTSSRKSSHVPSRSGDTDIQPIDWENALPNRQAPFLISPNSKLIGFTSRGVAENIRRPMPRSRPRTFRSRFSANRSDFQVRRRPEPQRFFHVSDPFIIVLDSR